MSSKNKWSPGLIVAVLQLVKDGIALIKPPKPCEPEKYSVAFMTAARQILTSEQYKTLDAEALAIVERSKTAD